MRSYQAILFLLLSIGCFLLPSCREEIASETITTASKKTLFKLVAPTVSGIDFKNEIKENLFNNYNVMAHQYFYRGAGVAVGDINNDGLQDIFLSANMGPNKLYLNEGNLKFKDISVPAGITKKGWSTGVVMADVNNDGYSDIYVCQAGPDPGTNRQNLLFINNQDLTFTEAALSYGLADENISRNAGFFDYDRDGDLDCYVLNESIYTRKPINYIFKQIEDNENLKKCSGKLFRNEGNGKFTDVTEAAGMLRYGHGLTLNISDINQDGWLDVYVSNDFTPPDFMYINQGDGRFKDEIKEQTKNISWASMGMDIADINNDGLSDIFTVEMASKDHFMDKTLMPSMNPALFHALINDLDYQRQYKFNTLQLNNGNGSFSNIAGLAGMLKSEWSWSTLLADFDNDGFKDCFITNGYRRYYTDNDSQMELKKIKKANHGGVPNELRESFYNSLPVRKSKNLVYKNGGNLTFSDYSDEWGLGMESFSNGASYCDLDNDGDLDLIVNNIDDFAFLYENTSEDNHFLKIKLNTNKPAIGTKAILKYNNQIQYLEYSPNRGYLSSTDQNLIFGLGKEKKLEELIIVWPDGKYQKIEHPIANETLVVNHKDASKQWNYDTKTNVPLLKEEQAITQLFKHSENDYDDFEKEVLLPYKQSTLGPLMSSGDINKDGLDDFYIAGAKGQSGGLFIQNKEGNFTFQDGSPWSKLHTNHEDGGSLFFDANGDNNLDLFVISGGNEFENGDSHLMDRLYINEGNGQFSYDKDRIPVLADIAYKVNNIDIDNDGDQDLFLAGRLVSKRYPTVPESYVLINDGKGFFTDESKSWLGDEQRIGLINDVVISDMNSDAKLDITVTGEFMGLRVFINNGHQLVDKSNDYFEEDTKGWWLSLEQADIDGDGDQDFIAGNLGLNSKYKATKERPFEIVVDDFDKNGTCDIVILKDYQGKKVPLRGRQCSSEQMPFIAEKFPTYKKFANASVEDILGKEQVSKAQKYQCQTFESSFFFNENGKYHRKKMPNIAQAFPIHDIIADDLNSDGYVDLIIAGNLYNMEVETPRIDAGNGLVLLGGENGDYNSLTQQQSGIFIPGECRSILNLNRQGNNNLIIFAQNDDKIKGYVIQR